MMEDEEIIDHPIAMSWDDFMTKGDTIEESEVKDRISNIQPDSTASLIYTSGTTGNPKGVELTHHNFAFITNQVVDLIVPLDRHDNYISWLPQAHSFGQVCDNHAFTVMGLNMTTVRNPTGRYRLCKGNTTGLLRWSSPHLREGLFKCQSRD